jgi:hypothetical protein
MAEPYTHPGYSFSYAGGVKTRGILSSGLVEEQPRRVALYIKNPL